MLSTTLLTAFALVALPQVQAPQWYAFEGCWRVTPQAEGAPVVCMAESDGGLRMATYISGELKSEQKINADGVARPISEGGCSGDEIGRFSADGARVYVRARLSCGAGMERLTTSALALTSPESLVEVRSLKVGDGTNVRVLSYEAVPANQYPASFQLAAGRDLARETARVQASVAMDMTDVVEASKQLDASVVDALLAARGSGFALSASNLQQLAEAGVPRSTLDVMVALSYPDHFRVAEANPQEARGAEWASPYYDPFLMNPYYRYDCYGLNYYSSWGCDYRYGYGYSPYGYGYYGSYFSPYGYYGGNGIIVVPSDGDGNALGGSRGGTVGAGGYTQGGQATRGTARPRSQPSGGARASVNPGSSSAPRASGGSSSSGGSVSRGGYTSGGSSSSGGSSRGTAKPRGGGR